MGNFLGYNINWRAFGLNLEVCLFKGYIFIHPKSPLAIVLAKIHAYRNINLDFTRLFTLMSTEIRSLRPQTRSTQHELFAKARDKNILVSNYYENKGF